jgi:membrane protein implicated in regulation of membrane protease activity
LIANEKKKIFYYFLLAEEGIAYYLTYKWGLILFACIISFFPTLMLWWVLDRFLYLNISWQLIFFVIWLSIVVFLICEFSLPSDIKKRVKDRVYPDEDEKNS